jgi:hypothetical protein
MVGPGSWGALFRTSNEQRQRMQKRKRKPKTQKTSGQMAELR